MSRASSASGRPNEENKKNFQTIYPQYIDASLGPKDGRRLTKSQSVVCPTLEEMIVAARALGFQQSFIDPTKSLPCAQSQLRQVPAPRGCLKVAVKQPVDVHYIKKSEFDVQTRGCVVDGVINKYELMRKICEHIKAKGGVRPQPINMTPQHQPKDGPQAKAAAAASSGSLKRR